MAGAIVISAGTRSIGFRPRYLELALLLVVGAVLAAGLVQLSLVTSGTIARTSVQLAGGSLALAVVLSLYLSWQVPLADQTIVPVVTLLSGIGLLMLARLDPDIAHRQLLWVGIGALAMVVTVTLSADLSTLRRYKYTAAVLGFLLIVGTIVHGVDINGSGYRRWFGFGGYYFQPVEALKVLIVVFFAAYLDEKKEVMEGASTRLGPLHLPPLQYFGPLLAMWGASLILLTVQNDLGSALLFFGIFLSMIYVATERAIYTWAGIAIFVAGVALAYRLFSHVRLRAEIWLDPWHHAQGQGYQLVQGLIALASGGIFGSGLGFGHPGLVPAVPTDFIFVAIGEELGLLGATLVLGLYAVLVLRGLRAGVDGRDTFERLLAVGLTATLAIQTFVILGGNLRVIPLTGVTLPFISYGGSSILFNYILIGLVLRVSHRGRAVR
ncbi:MAG: FtsW/RodA/SpoVE family cell cycle protein [Chloroflexota bacterium]